MIVNVPVPKKLIIIDHMMPVLITDTIEYISMDKDLYEKFEMQAVLP